MPQPIPQHRHNRQRASARHLGNKMPAEARSPRILRAFQPLLRRAILACVFSLLVPPTIAASAPDANVAMNSLAVNAAPSNPAAGLSPAPSGNSSPQVIYPSLATAPEAASAPRASLIAVTPVYNSPFLQDDATDAPVQLIGFQEASSVAAEPVPAGPSSVYGNPWSQMVHEDTGVPNLSAMAAQCDCAPPTCATPNCTGDYHSDPNAWHSQVLPQGIIYQSYLAGTKEPRFATYFDQSTDGATATPTPVSNLNGVIHKMWDVTLGARAGIWRYGNDDPNWPEGWQLDIEGAVFPRLAPDSFSTSLIGDDYRFGIPLTYGGDQWEFKMGYYHISAHVGDEYLLYINPNATRINYVRDSAILGAGYFFTPAFRTYAEIGVGAASGGAKPVELQFGCEWVQARNTGDRGGPFAAINGDLRQEVDYGGNVCVQFGWMWRQYARGSNVRIGGQYFYGKDDEYEFFTNTVSRIGWGIWYDF